jgi:hypothetical protein
MTREELCAPWVHGRALWVKEHEDSQWTPAIAVVLPGAPSAVCFYQESGRREIPLTAPHRVISWTPTK